MCGLASAVLTLSAVTVYAGAATRALERAASATAPDLTPADLSSEPNVHPPSG